DARLDVLSPAYEKTIPASANPSPLFSTGVYANRVPVRPFTRGCPQWGAFDADRPPPMSRAAWLRSPWLWRKETIGREGARGAGVTKGNRCGQKTQGLVRVVPP